MHETCSFRKIKGTLCGKGGLIASLAGGFTVCGAHLAPASVVAAVGDRGCNNDTACRGKPLMRPTVSESDFLYCAVDLDLVGRRSQVYREGIVYAQTDIADNDLISGHPWRTSSNAGEGRLRTGGD